MASIEQDNLQATRKLAPPKDLSHHLSHVTRNRQASTVKQFYKYFFIPGIGQLAGGLPNPHYFPYDDLEAKVARPDRWTPTPNKPVDPPASQAPPQTTRAKAQAPNTTTSSNHLPARVTVPSTSSEPDPLRKIDVASALQYGTAQGYPPLYSFIREFTREHLHPNVPYEGGPEVILTVGSTDGFQKALQCMNNEWVPGRDPIERKEGILVEQFAYMNAIQSARPRGMNIVPVGLDDEGMRAEGKGGLRDVLENWDYSRGQRPHLMYTVTIGQNPTSGTLSVARRKEIYAVCEKYDIIIVEDDPYWYLQFPSSNNATAKKADLKDAKQPHQKSSGYAFLDSLVPSYLSIDVSGRVIRLDTFSKTVAPGCRLGWITAQPAIVERILRITESSTQQPSGFVQSMVAELILGPNKGDPDSTGPKANTGWKMDGWVRWLEGLRGEYERRMTTMCDILDEGKELVKQGRRKSLSQMTAALALANPDTEPQQEDDWAVVEKTSMYTFTRPLGGMFIWIRFDFSTHPLAASFPPATLSRALWIFWTQKPTLLIVAPGALFAPTPEILAEEAWRYFRLCFAAIEKESLEGISKRFVEGCRSFWRIRDKGRIEELVGDDELDVETVEGMGEMGSLMGFC